jgi:hypothetical protein
MFKGFNNRQQHSFQNINFGGNYGQAYNFSRCLLWLDAAYGTTTVVNGANVSSWQDKINGVQYTQGTAAIQPTYVASDASFNNFPTMNFGTGNTRRMSSSTEFGLGNTTIALIVRMTATNANQQNLILSNGQRIGFGGGGNGSNVTGYGFYDFNANFTRSDIEDTNMHIVVANRSFVIVDGLNETVNTTAVNQTFTTIGSSQTSDNPNSFIVAEILLYDYLMSEADAIQLSNNINSKYLKY